MNFEISIKVEPIITIFFCQVQVAYSLDATSKHLWKCNLSSIKPKPASLV